MSILGRVSKILPVIRRPHSPCRVCGGSIEQRVGESNTRFWQRENCSAICGQRSRYGTAEKLAAAEGRSCVCSKPIIQREDEETYNYIRRQTCGDPKCISASKSTATLGRPKAAPDDREVVLDDMLDNYGAGFGGSQDRDPGDGGKLQVSKPANGLALSVAGRYL